MYDLHPCALVLLLCAGLAIACDSRAADTFDGIYWGTKTRSSNGTDCEAGKDVYDVTVTVKNNHFARLDEDVLLQVDISPDGSFYASALGTYNKLREIKGNITGNRFEADQSSSTCTFHLSLKRS
jgi:hypothetical protein